MEWTKLADDAVVARTTDALRGRGIEVIVAENREEAKTRIMQLIPQGARVMEGSSITLDQVGITDELASGKYVSLKERITAIGMNPIRNEAWRDSVSPEYGIGSVHAVTEDGEIVVASATGSQLAFYAYGAANLILVVGTQKIVKNLDEALKRIYEYTLPLVSEQVRRTYGVPGTNVNKILILEKEMTPDRIKLVFIKERLGF